MQRQCAICGEYKPIQRFEYGGKLRSYCPECNAEDQRIYGRQGLAAVHAWREKMRAKWQRK